VRYITISVEFKNAAMIDFWSAIEGYPSSAVAIFRNIGGYGLGNIMKAHCGVVAFIYTGHEDR